MSSPLSPSPSAPSRPTPASGTAARPFRLALFADSAPQLLERALLTEASARAFPLDLRTWGFTEPAAVQAELAAFQPDALLYWACAEAARTPDISALLASLPYPLYCYNAAILDDGTCGSLSCLHPTSLRARLTAWNASLVALARRDPRLALIDLEAIEAHLGRAHCFDARLWESAHIALAPAALPEVARRTLDTLLARLGHHLRKVVVTDLDNTLWSGILSETGPDALDLDAPGRDTYRAWLRTLSARGILLAIASHNNRQPVLDALETLSARRGLGLPPQAFSAIEADWGPKADMLRRIANALNLSTDALVFLDDRPEQRAQVREALPDVAVPELPEDPALWLPFLADCNLFETPQITEDDALRAQSLRDDHARAEALAATSPEAYLDSLRQQLTPEPLGPDNLARAAQLTQRCNQFNMRASRYTPADLAGRTGWLYRLKDRFGDLGLVSAVILAERPEGTFIEAWVLSCRAFNRHLERDILAHLRALYPTLCGQYIPSARNARCQSLYAQHHIPELPA